MLAISIWQPWASAIALGAKRCETRSWPTSYRGPLAIHAARSIVGIIDILRSDAATLDLWSDVLQCLRGDLKQKLFALPKGAVLATCRLQACEATRQLLQAGAVGGRELLLGDYYPAGRFGWCLGDVVALPKPFKVPGRQRLFEIALPQVLA